MVIKYIEAYIEAFVREGGIDPLLQLARGELTPDDKDSDTNDNNNNGKFYYINYIKNKKK